MNIIKECPKCGSDTITYMDLLRYPPIPIIKCWNCGWIQERATQERKTILETLSDLKERFNLFDPEQEEYYRALCAAIKALKAYDNIKEELYQIINKLDSNVPFSEHENGCQMGLEEAIEIIDKNLKGDL